MKKITLILFAFFSFLELNAQVSSYSFSQSSGTYSPITGGTVLGIATNDDDNFNALEIGFTFRFNSVNYTQFSANANGIIAMGATVINSYTSLSSGTSNNVVAAFNGDLQGNVATGELSYITSGTAPNRVLTIQWKSYKRYTFSTTDGPDDYNFQIKLFETSNNVSIVYGSILQNAFTRTLQVGLRGNSNTNFNNRTTLTDWSATTAGATNAANCTLTTAIKPASGLTFTFTPPACEAPTPVTTSAITTTTATISWPASNSAPSNGYQYVASLTPTTPTTAGTPVAGLTANLTMLNPSSNYYVYIRSDCGGTFSTWNGPFQFATACAPATSYTQNFDNSPTGSTNPLPLCWSRVGTTGNAYVEIGGVAPGSAPNRLYMFSNGTNGTVAIAAMPIISNLSANTNRLKFKAYATAANRNIEVGYLTTPGDTSTFTLIQSIALTTTTAATAQEYYVTPNGLTIGDSNLCFRLAHPTTGENATVYIDDVSWETAPLAIPVCATPTATPNPNCGNYASTISWPAVTDADGYLISIGTNANGNDIFNNQAIGNVLTYNFTGTPGTIYNYKITPFNTLGNAQGCTVQSFTTAGNLCHCLPSTATSDTFISNFSTTGGSANISSLNTGYSPGGFLDGTAQFVQAYPTSSFVFNSTIVGGDAGYTIWIDWDNSITFEDAEKVFNTTDYSFGPFSGTITVPAGTPLGNYRMRVATDWLSQNPSVPCGPINRGEFEDYTVQVVAQPACAPPSSLNVSLITASGATLGWTDINNSTAWNVEYDITGFTQGTGTVVNNVTNPYAVSTLLPNTTYQFYVQSVCAVGTSTWSGPFAFTTACTATTVPYLMDFESAIVPAVPNCTSVVNSGSGNVWNTVNNPGAGFTTKTLNYTWNGTNAANTWFFTQGVTLTAGTSYRIQYNYGNNSTFYVEKLTVAYGNSPSSAAMTNPIFDHPSISTGTIQLNQVDFIPTTSGVYYFGFQANSIANQFNLYVDNISVDVTPACSAPINVVASNVVSNGVTINWSTVTSAVTYEYVNDTTMADPTVPGTTISSTTVSFNNLLPLTQYYFHVRSNCAGTDSAWSTITYTTPATPPANDLCANAQVLTPGGTFATNPLVVTNVGATNSLETAPGCALYSGGDLFYTVVVPASGSITIETNPTTGSTITDTGLAVYSGSCGALVLVECDDDDSATGNFSLVALTGRTPGEILTIRVWEYGNDAFGNFQVSAYDSSLGSNTFDNSAFSFYPNPVKDFLNLNYSESIQKVQVLNLVGQSVKNQNINATSGKIDMSNLPSGAYIVKISTDLGEKTIKVIKE